MLIPVDRQNVRDASDPKQIRRARRVQERHQTELVAAIKAVMQTQPGRLVFWELLSAAGVFRSVFNQHGGIQSWNIGRQDFGQEILQDLMTVDEDAYLLMEKEARAKVRRENADTDAAFTPKVEDEQTSN